MDLQEYEAPTKLLPRGGGASEGASGFAGLGGNFAGPMGDFTAKYLQARLSGMNRATVDPRVNRRRVMASPEFALAKALGISTVHNSGGRQIDVGRMQQRAQSPSSMERDYANARLKEFNERNAGVELNPVMAVAGLGSMQDAIPNERPSVAIPSEPEKPSEPRKPIAPRQPSPGAPTPGPSAPQQTGTEETAKPISRADAERATQAPIGAQNRPPIAPYGQPEMQTPQRQTTKGPRLDTRREPQATGGAGTFEGGQQARKDADQWLQSQLSDDAMKERAQAGGRYVGPAPTFDQDGINSANNYRDNAQRNWDADPRGPTGIPYDAEGKMAVAAARNRAQDEREAIKKDYNFRADRYYGQMERNQAAFGNPYGPDGGKTRELQQLQKTPELAPLGGYDEKYTVGARGGNPNAKRGEPGYMEKEIVPVGPMTNRPAASKEEYEARMSKYNEEKAKQEGRNRENAAKKEEAAKTKSILEINKKRVAEMTSTGKFRQPTTRY